MSKLATKTLTAPEDVQLITRIDYLHRCFGQPFRKHPTPYRLHHGRADDDGRIGRRLSQHRKRLNALAAPHVVRDEASLLLQRVCDTLLLEFPEFGHSLQPFGV